MEVMLSYKQTEVGVIPQDWTLKLLPDLVEITNGKAHEQFIVEHGRYILVNAKFISTDGKVRKFTNKNFCPAKKDSIILVMSDVPNGKALAKCFLVDVDDRYAVNQSVCAFKPKKVVPTYLFYYLNRNKYFLSFDDGIQQTHLLSNVFKRCPVLVPSTEEEQRAIALALSDVDGLLSALDCLIAKKRDIKRAAMQQLLTGQIRLPGFSGGWGEKRLGELLTICHGKSQHEVEAQDGPYPILATGGQIGNASRPLYDKPSVLIGRKGTINQPQYMDTPFWTVDTLFYSSIKNDNCAKFLYYCFCLIDWMQYNEASGVPSLNARTIENIEIDCPKSDEQAAIAAVLSDLDTELAALEARLTKTHALKQAMISELLTGKTRLPT